MMTTTFPEVHVQRTVRGTCATMIALCAGNDMPPTMLGRVIADVTAAFTEAGLTYGEVIGMEGATIALVPLAQPFPELSAVDAALQGIGSEDYNLAIRDTIYDGNPLRGSGQLSIAQTI
jgi:hypothetical protein